MEETETLFANPLLDMKTIEYQRMIGNSGKTDEFFFTNLFVTISR